MKNKFLILFVALLALQQEVALAAELSPLQQFIGFCKDTIQSITSGRTRSGLHRKKDTPGHKARKSEKLKITPESQQRISRIWGEIITRANHGRLPSTGELKTELRLRMFELDENEKLILLGSIASGGIGPVRLPPEVESKIRNNIALIGIAQMAANELLAQDTSVMAWSYIARSIIQNTPLNLPHPSNMYFFALDLFLQKPSDTKLSAINAALAFVNSPRSVDNSLRPTVYGGKDLLSKFRDEYIRRLRGPR